MLGKRSDRKGLWEADRLYLDYVGQDTCYGLLASLRGQLFNVVHSRRRQALPQTPGPPAASATSRKRNRQPPTVR